MFGLEEQKAHYAAVRQRLQRNGRPEAPPPIKAPAPEPVRPPAPAPVHDHLPLWRSPALPIIQEVCAKHEVTIDQIMRVDRRKMIVTPRQEVMYRLHYEMNWSLGKIGRYFDKDHSTIAHSIANFKKKHQL